MLFASTTTNFSVKCESMAPGAVEEVIHAAVVHISDEPSWSRGLQLRAVIHDAHVGFNSLARQLPTGLPICQPKGLTTNRRWRLKSSQFWRGNPARLGVSTGLVIHFLVSGCLEGATPSGERRGCCGSIWKDYGGAWLGSGLDRMGCVCEWSSGVR